MLNKHLPSYALRRHRRAARILLQEGSSVVALSDHNVWRAFIMQYKYGSLCFVVLHALDAIKQGCTPEDLDELLDDAPTISGREKALVALKVLASSRMEQLESIH